MAKYTQANRPLAVTTPLGPDALLLEKFSGTEAFSQLFRFQLDLLAEKEMAVPFQELLGQRVTVRLSLPAGRTRSWDGIISRLSQGPQVRGPQGDVTFVRYRAEMVPRLWLWTKKFQSRIFQHLSVPDILKSVLQGLDVAFETRGVFHPRDYCVQYRESDFAFASRLMEEEGIFYFFRPTKDGHQMVLANTPLSAADLPEPSTIIYEEVEGGLREETRITAWEKTQEVCSGKYTLWDHCFELTGQHLEAEQLIPPSVPVGKVTQRLQVAGNDKLEVYDYPGGYSQRFDGVDAGGGDRSADIQRIFEDNRRTVKIRMEEAAAQSLVIQGTSNCGHFVAGSKFTLQRHFDANGEYLLTEVDHSASMAGGYTTGGETPFTYENRFRCLPLALPFRPQRETPKPQIVGTQTATVVGPQGELLFVDKYGRVKVQFHWDRQGKNNADSSCWIRVAQIWAGPRWGAFFWPRVGHEVVVVFEEGDPDRPIIVGSVYNGANMPPTDLPAERMMAGIKSLIFGGDPAFHFNAVIFHDTPECQYVQVHSEKTQMDNSEQDRFQFTPKGNISFTGSFPFT